MPEVKWTPFPDNRRNPMSATWYDYQEQIRRTKAALEVKLIAENAFDMVVLANGFQYETEYNLGPAWKKNDGNAKTWWAPYAFEACMPGRNPDDSFATVQNTDSDEGLQWTSRELQEFYKLYHSHFPVIPKFVLRQFSMEEAGRAQFGDGPAMDFPLAKVMRNDPTQTLKTTFPRDIAFRVKDGALEWCRISEYKAAYPLTVTATIPSANRPPASMIVMSASMILANPETTAEQKVEALRRILG